MFNSIKVGQKNVQYVPYCKEIKEIRAPTAESVRLLCEMEEKSRQKIIDAFVIQTNIIKDIACVVYEDFDRFGSVIDIKFKINEEENNFKFNPTTQAANSSEIVREIVKIVAQRISEKIVIGSLNTISRSGVFKNNL